MADGPIAGVVEAVKRTVAPQKTIELPADVKERIKRGDERLARLTSRRREAIEFTKNNHYVTRSEDGMKLVGQSTVNVSQGGKKADHRVRRSHDLIGPNVQEKVAAVTQRIPGYECTPTSADPEDYTAAKMSEKVLAAGYEKWHMRKAAQDLVWNALVTEEGFIMAYWDSQIGPYYEVEVEDPQTGEIVLNPETQEPLMETVGEGDIRLQVLSGEEVIWEPGVDFEDSPWWAIKHAKPKDYLEAEKGFIGGTLKADATLQGGTQKDAKGSNLVMTTEYLERPSLKHPQGRHLIAAAGRLIFPEEPYPLEDSEGQIIDEPCIHRLTYAVDASTERGKGFVTSQIDAQRQYDAAMNKAMEYLQMGLSLQFIAPQGSIKSKITDQPGAVIEVDPMAPFKVEAREHPTFPSEVFTLADRSVAEINGIAHKGEIPPQIRSASGVQTIFEQSSLAWSDFLANLAEVHARLGRDCLTLVQRHYTEDRLIQIRGRTGYMPPADFKGADLRDQTDVRVQPGSLEGKTRQAVKQEIQNVVQMFPGYWPPEVVLSAMNGGNAEGLMQGYEEDVGRANMVIAQIRSGTFWDQEDRPAFPGEEGYEHNPETGEVETDGEGTPIPLSTVPGWMPAPYDNAQVWLSVITNWLKSDEFNRLDGEAKRAAMAIYGALIDMERREAQKKAELQNAMAESQGLRNAASPQTAKPGPSLPTVTPGATASEG